MTQSADGLTSEEARLRLGQFGPNSMPDTSSHPARSAIKKLWAPIPWMLEAAIVLEVVLGKDVEAGIIAVLLVFNAALGFFQEARAQATLAALKMRLALTASVRRDGVWKNLPSADLVPGDIVKLSLGGVVAADVQIIEGSVLLDQSMLTGESIGTEAGPGFQTFAGALVRRGEAVARVTATGTLTKFGRTAELVRTAHVVSSQQKAVLRVVRNLAVFNGILIVILVAYALGHAMPASEIIPLVLTAVLASIPVALPATFTLASALGARALARQGVLPTRLSAVDEAASIDVLCADKTGTLTRNQLTVTAVRPMPGFRRVTCLDDGSSGQFRRRRGSGGRSDSFRCRKESRGESAQTHPLRTLSIPPPKCPRRWRRTRAWGRCASSREPFPSSALSRLFPPRRLRRRMNSRRKVFECWRWRPGRLLTMQLLGLIALSDPAREDSAVLVTELKTLGVRTVMVTGDAPATAAIVAHAVGLDGAICPPGRSPPKFSPEVSPSLPASFPKTNTNW